MLGVIKLVDPAPWPAAPQRRRRSSKKRKKKSEREKKQRAFYEYKVLGKKKQTPVLIVNCAHGIKIQLNMKSPVAAKDSSYTE